MWGMDGGWVIHKDAEVPWDGGRSLQGGEDHDSGGAKALPNGGAYSPSQG